MKARPETSMLVHIRPGWHELRDYLAGTDTRQGNRRAEAFVCTMGEKEYALEMWRLLDPKGALIGSGGGCGSGQRELRDRVVSVKSCEKKSIRAATGGILPRHLCVVLDDRTAVWEEVREIICAHANASYSSLLLSVLNMLIRTNCVCLMTVMTAGLYNIVSFRFQLRCATIVSNVVLLLSFTRQRKRTFWQLLRLCRMGHPGGYTPLPKRGEEREEEGRRWRRRRKSHFWLSRRRNA